MTIQWRPQYLCIDKMLSFNAKTVVTQRLLTFQILIVVLYSHENELFDMIFRRSLYVFRTPLRVWCQPHKNNIRISRVTNFEWQLSPRFRSDIVRYLVGRFIFRDKLKVTKITMPRSQDCGKSVGKRLYEPFELLIMTKSMTLWRIHYVL